MRDMYHLPGFCSEMHCFSPIAFQRSALTLGSQYIKAEYFLDLEAAASVLAFSSSGQLISNSPYTIGCNHEVNGLLAPSRYFQSFSLLQL